MFVKIGGGVDGWRIYFIDGKKDGRSQTRDELDVRVMLPGCDIDETDKIIHSMKSKETPEQRQEESDEDFEKRKQHEAQKHLHIALSWYEDGISHEQMIAGFNAYMKKAFAAFDPDEYT